MVAVNDIVKFEPVPGLTKVISTRNDKVMLVENTIKKGTEVPAHYHPDSELLTVVVEGKLRLNIDGGERVLEKGDSIIISKNTCHSAIAIEESYVLDIFVPPAEELISNAKTKL